MCDADTKGIQIKNNLRPSASPGEEYQNTPKAMSHLPGSKILQGTV